MRSGNLYHRVSTGRASDLRAQLHVLLIAGCTRIFCHTVCRKTVSLIHGLVSSVLLIVVSLKIVSNTNGKSRFLLMTEPLQVEGIL